MSETGLQLKDWKKKIERNIGEEEWVVVYSNHESTFESVAFYSALIPNKKVFRVFPPVLRTAKKLMNTTVFQLPV